MRLLLFNIVASAVYCAGMMFLIWEYKTSSKEARKELETYPLIFAITFLYFVAIFKTQQLAEMFVAG